MTYQEREIARLEGVKDGLIKKLVEDCEEINDQIIALRNGKPRKNDSEIYFERGYSKAIDDVYSIVMNENHDTLIEWLQNNLKEDGNERSI